jgi:hypothetical protein
MKLPQKDRANNSAQGMYNVNLLEAAIEGDPSENVAE